MLSLSDDTRTKGLLAGLLGQAERLGLAGKKVAASAGAKDGKSAKA